MAHYIQADNDTIFMKLGSTLEVIWLCRKILYQIPVRVHSVKKMSIWIEESNVFSSDMYDLKNKKIIRIKIIVEPTGSGSAHMSFDLNTKNVIISVIDSFFRRTFFIY